MITIILHMIEKIYPVLLGICSLGFLITIHEFGHLIFCKFFGVPVANFAVGIGPTIFKKIFGKTKYSIGIIPIAGYVNIGSSKEKNNDLGYILRKTSFLQCVCIILGGIIFNILFSYIALFLSIGIGNIDLKFINNFRPNTTITLQETENEMEPNNENAIVIYCNGKRVKFYHDIVNEFTETNSDSVELGVSYSNCENFHRISLEKKDINKIIVTPNESSFVERSIESIYVTTKIIKTTATGIIQSIKKFDASNIAGPLGVIQMGTKAIEKGFMAFLVFMAIVSIGLAVVNLLPIPILDGGQLIMLGLYRLFKKRIPSWAPQIITYLSIGIMLLLTIYSTKNDIIRFLYH